VHRIVDGLRLFMMFITTMADTTTCDHQSFELWKCRRRHFSNVLQHRPQSIAKISYTSKTGRT